MKRIINKLNRIRIKYTKSRLNKIDSIFIVSTGRTGTLFFETFFNELKSKAFAIHEPEPDLYNIGIKKIRAGASSKEIVDYILENRQTIIRSEQKIRTVETYIECNPFMSIILDEVKFAFPNSKFIIITRDAKSFVKSALNKSPNGDGEMFMYGEKDHRSRMTAKDYPAEKIYKEWSKFNRIEKVSWYWNKCNLILLEFLSCNKDISIHVSFEKLFSKNMEIREMEVSRVMRFTGINQDPNVMKQTLAMLDNKRNSTKDVVYEGYEQWSEDDKVSFSNLTKDATELIGKLA